MPSSNTEWKRKVPPVGHAERFYHRRNTEQVRLLRARAERAATAALQTLRLVDGEEGRRMLLLPSETHGWPQAAGLPSVL